MDPILKVVEHRPFPMPAGPWIMQQVWHDLLFAHWPLPAEEMRRLVPRELQLDTLEGSAWLAVTPFRMTGVRPRGMPALPWLSAFPELNVRTYVRFQDKPGVFFCSLDCANAPAVWAARTLFRLPYKLAWMTSEQQGEAIRYRSRRREKPVAEFAGSYQPVSTVRPSAAGTLEYFLTERYCLYAVDRGCVYRAEIHHLPWPLQRAGADIEVNTMASAAGVSLPDIKPVLHFSRQLRVFVWPLRRVG